MRLATHDSATADAPCDNGRVIPNRMPSRTSAPAGPVLRATIEYDGGRYRGWQAQINARTVQGTLLAAAHELWGPGVRVHGAGRTDAGVHAFGQVASVHLSPRVRVGDPADALKRWNDLLPPDVNVLSLDTAAPSFHARHDAVRRVYRYRIARRRTGVREALRLLDARRARRRRDGPRRAPPRGAARLPELLREPRGARLDDRRRRAAPASPRLPRPTGSSS